MRELFLELTLLLLFSSLIAETGLDRDVDLSAIFWLICYTTLGTDVPLLGRLDDAIGCEKTCCFLALPTVLVKEYKHYF